MEGIIVTVFVIGIVVVWWIISKKLDKSSQDISLKDISFQNTPTFDQSKVFKNDCNKKNSPNRKWLREFRIMIAACLVIYFTSLVLPSKIEIIVKHDINHKIKDYGYPITIEVRNR